jgi:hypothetical protein
MRKIDVLSTSHTELIYNDNFINKLQCTPNYHFGTEKLSYIYFIVFTKLMSEFLSALNGK